MLQESLNKFIFILLLTQLFYFSFLTPLYSQTIDSSNINYDIINTKSLINVHGYTENLIDPFRRKEKDSNGNSIIRLKNGDFNNIANTVINADRNIKDYSILNSFPKNRNEIGINNAIKIGIINADVTLLTDEQLKDNLNKDSEHSKKTSYENIFFIASSFLQEEVFQGEVDFYLSKELYYTNIVNKIQKVEIDFQDGMGYQSYSLSNQTIHHTFTSVGTRSIAIKLVTERGTYISYSDFTVHQLSRPEVFLSKTLSATSVKGGRVANQTPGADIRIYTGCDGIFDKPIIILEGFDAQQDVSLEDLTVKYYPHMYAYRNNGYDLVFVNYHDAQTWIQDNAEVVKGVINYINSIKTGNNSLVVLGESMSGLVARYALKSMENAGQNHNVSKFIAFDTPNKGANIPPGVTTLSWWVKRTAIPWYQIFSLFSGSSNIIKSLSSPAAKQMLLNWSDENNLESAKEFNEFQVALNNLGNQGYPTQCKNIALISGSIYGLHQDDGNNSSLKIQPGQTLLYNKGVYVFVNYNFEIWSNKINETTKVFQGVHGGISLPSLRERYTTRTQNYDRLGGGYFDFDLSNKDVTKVLKFSFVPGFSAIDYKGPLNSDSDYTFSIQNLVDNNYQVINNSLTPFQAIYGDAINSFHAVIAPKRAILNALGRIEGFFDHSSSTSCTPPVPSKPQQRVIVGQRPGGLSGEPPVVMIYGLRDLPQTLCDGSTIQLAFQPPFPANNLNQYVFKRYIRITKPDGSIEDSNELNLNESTSYFNWNSSGRPSGLYQFSSIVEYYGTTVQRSIASTSIYLCPGSSINCNYQENAFVYRLNELGGAAVYAKRYNSILFATTDQGAFISRSTLINNGCLAQVANCFAESDPRSSVNNNQLAAGCYTIRGKQSNKYVQSGPANTVEQLKQYSGNGQTNQIWKVEDAGSGVVRILSTANGLGWDSYGITNNNGAMIAQYAYGGGNNQHFTFSNLGDGTYRIAPKHSPNKAVEIANYSTADGGLVQQWDWNGGDQQRWYVTSSACSTTTGTSITCNGRSFSDGQFLGTYLDKNVYVRVIGSCLYVTVDSPNGGAVGIDWIRGLNWASGSWAITPMSDAEILSCFKAGDQPCTSSGGGNNNSGGSNNTGGTSTTVSCGGYSFTNGQLIGTAYGANVYIKVQGTCLYVTKDDPNNGALAKDWLYIVVDNNTWASGVTHFPRSVVDNCFKAGDQPCTSSGGRVPISPSLEVINPTLGQILIVPNPATTRIEIRLTGDLQLKRAMVYDLQGRKLIQSDDYTVDIENLAAGSYLIRAITQDGYNFSSIFIKQ